MWLRDLAIQRARPGTESGAWRHHAPLSDTRRNGTPPMTPRQFLGKELCRARVAEGFSSGQALADHLGFERTTVAKAESGERVPSDAVLTAWCTAWQAVKKEFQTVGGVSGTAGGP